MDNEATEARLLSLVIESLPLGDATTSCSTISDREAITVSRCTRKINNTRIKNPRVGNGDCRYQKRMNQQILVSG